mmetsp:Transcript_40808/g.75923  ORF Transcript_40808/g.75923 Transcript_40808/m.75923 type:complete len:444 (-) Transcript_40808:76-1407(-)
MSIQYTLRNAALRAWFLIWLGLPTDLSERLYMEPCLLQRTAHLSPGSQAALNRTAELSLTEAAEEALGHAARSQDQGSLAKKLRQINASGPNAWHSSFISLGEEIQWHGDIFGNAKERLDVGDEGMRFFHTASREDWSILFTTIVLLMLIDFCWLRHVTGGTTRMNVCVLCFWIFIGIAFNALVWARKGREAGILWCSGYLLEWILSMDNLFVFHLVFRVYATPKELLHKALFLGIIGAVLFRMCFFMALASLLHLVHWFRFVFGIVLIWSGIQAAREDEDEVDVANLKPVQWLKRCLGSRLTESYDTEEKKIFISKDGKTQATLMVPVIFCLEMTDILFAVDSVSAKVAQIPNYYLAYSSSVIAIFGLRAMFFILRDMVDFFDLLKYGLCFILVFIGVELLLEDYVKLPAQVVCVVIFSVFLVCISGSTATSIYKRGTARSS